MMPKKTIVFFLMTIVLLFPVAAFSSSSLLKKVVVGEGDSLWKLSRVHYGSHRFYKMIQSINRVRNPVKLYVGQTLLFPTSPAYLVETHLKEDERVYGWDGVMVNAEGNIFGLRVASSEDDRFLVVKLDGRNREVVLVVEEVDGIPNYRFIYLFVDLDGDNDTDILAEHSCRCSSNTMDVYAFHREAGAYKRYLLLNYVWNPVYYGKADNKSLILRYWDSSSNGRQKTLFWKDIVKK